MRALTARQLGQIVGGTVTGDATRVFTAVFSDSRKPVRDGLFVALRGERFDGHDFVAQVLAAGAGGAIVEGASARPGAHDAVLIEVADTQRALDMLATALRNLHPGRFVAVTGSVGKTTVKDMLAACLSAAGSVGKTPGNLNNHIGVPLTLAALDGTEDFVVTELGMSAAGEITRLTHIVRPDVALVTRAEAAHLEFFASVDAIADAKAELYEHLAPGGVAVVNADDARLSARAEARFGGRRVSYGHAASHAREHVRIASTLQTGAGLLVTLAVMDKLIEVKLASVGRHNAENVAAAIACCIALGVDSEAAARALSTGFKPAAHRLTLVDIGGMTLLDDSYNANPASTQAALVAFDDIAVAVPRADRLAVLGSMRELGPSADALHAQIGTAAAAVAGMLIATGPHADALALAAREAGAVVLAAADVDALLPAIGEWARAHPLGAMLLKGSRGERLERVLDHLRAELDATPDADATLPMPAGGR